MKNLIKTLKSVTLGDAVEPIRDTTLLEFILSFTGVCSILQLSTAMFAKLLGDRETADRCMSGAFLSLLINALLTMYSAEPELPAAAVADDGADDDVSVEISLDDSEEL